MHEKGKHAIALARMGFKVFPLREDVPDAEPSEIKKPALEGDWKQHATTDEAQIEKWWSKRDYNIAVATLPGSDLAILDYDCKPGQNGAAALRTHDLLDMPQSLRVRTPSGGLHIYFKAPNGHAIPNSASKVARNVDVRGNERGGYVVAPGSTIHGKPYTFEGDNRTLEELPDWLIKLATANRKKTAAKQGEVLGEIDDPAAIERAAQWLKDEAPEAIEGEGGNNETFRVACRVRDFGLSEQTALDLLAEHWNDLKAHPPWPIDELQTVVANAYKYASLPVGVANAKAEFEAVGLIFDEAGQNPPSQKKPKLYLVDASEGADMALDVMAEPLIDEVLDCGALSVLYGPSGSGKTFVALDLAFAVASGKPWHGNRTVKKGLVVYVATEGGRGIFKRLSALKKTRGFDPSMPFAVVPCPVDLLTAGKESDTKKLVALIREAEAKYRAKAELIVIDTLSRALAGGDENASTDMGVFIRHVDRIRAESQAHVMVVHHTGKDTSKGARGWSGIRAATDNELEILDGKMTFTKQRDDEQQKPIAFRLRSVEIGNRKKDGKAVTSCTVEWMDAPEFNLELSPNEIQKMSILSAVARENTTDNILTTGQIVAALSSADDRPGRTSVYELLSALSAKSAIRNIKKGQWLIGDRPDRPDRPNPPGTDRPESPAP